MPIANFDLTNRIAIITGASRGNGEAIARGFVEQGATVVITARKSENLEKVAASIRQSGGKPPGLECQTAGEN